MRIKINRKFLEVYKKMKLMKSSSDQISSWDSKMMKTKILIHRTSTSSSIWSTTETPPTFQVVPRTNNTISSMSFKCHSTRAIIISSSTAQLLKSSASKT